MTPFELWAELARLGVKVTADGDALRVNAQRGTITPAIRAEIAAHKAALLDLARADAVDDQAEPGGWASVTLILPDGCGLATVAGKWRRLPSGEIEATYTRAELQAALWASRPAATAYQQIPTLAEATA